MVGSRIDYPDLATEAARMVMLELVRILGEYKDSMAIVGGWVPELLFANAQPKHVGTRLGTLGEVAYALFPKAVDQVLSTAYRVFPESAAAKGTPDPDEHASAEQVAVANLMRGVHW